MTEQDIDKYAEEVAITITEQCDPTQVFKTVELIAARISSRFEKMAYDADQFAKSHYEVSNRLRNAFGATGLAQAGQKG